jgi:hypothetical protein
MNHPFLRKNTTPFSPAVPVLRTMLLAAVGTLACHLQSTAQNDIVKIVMLDEFVIQSGWDSTDVARFIHKVRTDTTFYKAFLNLKYFPHHKEGHVLVYNKDETSRGTMHRTARQHLSEKEEMWVEIIHETHNGKIKNKKGEWKYLTAEMYDDVFFPAKPQRVSNRIVSMEQELVTGSRIEKHKAQLKRMMFNPGEAIGTVPLIGDKMAIFDDHMVPYYQYAIFQTTRNGKSCIAFSCIAKPGSEKHTVIQDLTSYFDPETNDVLAREYRLAHRTILFDFDIQMKVENEQQNGWLLPVKVWYDGAWDVPLKKPEIIRFELRCSEYRTHVGRYSGRDTQR